MDAGMRKLARKLKELGVVVVACGLVIVLGCI